MATQRGFSDGDLPIYYEVHGGSRADRAPLVLIHGGGSTIESNWARLLPLLAGERQVLAVELQGHGHTGSIGRTPSFDASADDVASLIAQLELPPVDLLGFSNGGQVALRLAIRHPESVRRVIAASAPYRPDGMVEGFWDGLRNSDFGDLPKPYLDADLAASGDPEHARSMFEIDRALMLGFVDWPEDQLASITVPTLVVVGDRDVVTVEHALALSRLIPDAGLLVVPSNHGGYLGELAASVGDADVMSETLPFLLRFLDAA
jgi:pimeloyl-ACP methyl ester carboxylesterase